MARTVAEGDDPYSVSWRYGRAERYPSPTAPWASNVD